MYLNDADNVLKILKTEFWYFYNLFEDFHQKW